MVAGRGSAGGDALPGTVVRVPEDDRAPLVVVAGDGVVRVREVQPAAGKRMSAGAYARGHALESGVVLGAGAL
jgi:methionyl-tRNA formyltransferase